MKRARLVTGGPGLPPGPESGAHASPAVFAEAARRLRTGPVTVNGAAISFNGSFGGHQTGVELKTVTV